MLCGGVLGTYINCLELASDGAWDVQIIDNGLSLDDVVENGLIHVSLNTRSVMNLFVRSQSQDRPREPLGGPAHQQRPVQH